jgi:hypothetical protein
MLEQRRLSLWAPPRARYERNGAAAGGRCGGCCRGRRRCTGCPLLPPLLQRPPAADCNACESNSVVQGCTRRWLVALQENIELGRPMTTHVTLEDGRVLGTSNGEFDALVEFVAAELEHRSNALRGFRKWLLEQRCLVQGPGVGYLDLRELSPPAVQQFKTAFLSGIARLSTGEVPETLRMKYSLLERMCESISRGEPPEALTSEHWKIDPWNGDQRGPGWGRPDDC